MDHQRLRPGLQEALDGTGRGGLNSASPTSSVLLIHERRPQWTEEQVRAQMLNKSKFPSSNYNQFVQSFANHGSAGSLDTNIIASQPYSQEAIQDSSANHYLRTSPSFNQVDNLSSGFPMAFQRSRYKNQSSVRGETQSIDVTNMSKEFHGRIESLLAKIGSKDIPAYMQVTLVEHAKSIAQEFGQQQRKLQNAFECAIGDRNQSLAQLEQARRDLEVAVADRDRAYQERDAHQKSINDLLLRATKDAESVDRLQAHWKEVNDALVHKLNVQDEQLKGKRALWLDYNPGSSARRDAMNSIRDPFQSPTLGSQSSSLGKGYMGSRDSPLTGSPLRSSFNTQATFALGYGPPPQFAPSKSNLSQQESFTSNTTARRGPRRRPNLPTQKALPAIDSWTPDGRCYNTEPGSLTGDDTPAPPPVSIRADLEGMSADEISDIFQLEWSRLFALIEGFVKIYCSEPNLKSDRAIARSNQALWEFMMNCAYPGMRQDSHTHIMAILNDGSSRHWLAMRMIIGYLANEMLTVELFGKFGAPEEAELQIVKNKLAERGLANEARQQLINRQVRVVNDVLAEQTYEKFHISMLNFQSKRLRDMIGPVINKGSSRSAAGRDLGAIAMHAYNLSLNMYTSHLTFQIYFPATADKFNAATMVSKDHPTSNPLELQIKQMRLKLVITPVVTMRDDRGTTIKAKSLHNSSVLIMG